VAIVGYTNAGKTSLIKALTNDQSLKPRNQLFATLGTSMIVLNCCSRLLTCRTMTSFIFLDVTTHAGVLSNALNVLYVDTVGFIGRLCFIHDNFI
jgi:50S ribosomal subunit-associated GTPase HflX